MATRKPVKPVRNRRTLTQEDHTFDLIMERFDKVDQDNAAIVKSVADHVEKDNGVYKVVEKHSTYWGLLLKIAGVLLVATVTLLFTSSLK